MYLKNIGLILATIMILFIGCNSKASLKERQKEFKSSLLKLDTIGLKSKDFKPNSDKTSFTVEINDADKFTNYLLKASSLEALDPKIKNYISKILMNKKIGVDIDWKKYKDNKNNSVFVYPLSTDKVKSKILKKLLNDKDIGVYLTFNSNNEVKSAKVKDLIISDNGARFKTKGLKIDIEESSFNSKNAYAYKLNFDKFTVTDETNRKNYFLVSKINCDIDIEDRLLGKHKCKLGEVTFNAKSNYSKTATNITIKNISFSSIVSKKSDILVNNGNIKIFNIDIFSKDHKRDDNFSIKNYQLNFSSKGFKYQDILNILNLFKDNNLTADTKLSKLFSTISNIFKNKITLTVKSSLDTFEFNGTDKSKPIKLYLTDYKGDFTLNNYKTIIYSSNTHYNLTIKAPYGNIKIQGYSDKFVLKDIYNIIPEFFEFINTVLSKKVSQIDIHKESIAQGNKLINNGLVTEFYPKVKKFTADFYKQEINIKDIDIAMYLKLDKNSLDMTNPMSNVLIIPKIIGKGHIKMDKNSFNELKKDKNSIAYKASQYAKEKNNEIIFKIKIDNGKLFINDKQIK